jgi:hypothetical protein
MSNIWINELLLFLHMGCAEHFCLLNGQGALVVELKKAAAV